MSNKEKKKNANKALEALKRKKYGHGGLPKKKKKNLFDDSQGSTEDSQTGNENDTSGSGQQETGDVIGGSGSSFDTTRSGSIKVGGNTGNKGDGFPYAEGDVPTAAERAAIVAWYQANPGVTPSPEGSKSSSAPLGVEVTGPEVTLDTMTEETILDKNGNVPVGTSTKEDDVQKLKKLTATEKATAGTAVTATTGAATQADTSQATTAVAPSRLNQYASTMLEGLKVEGEDKQALENYIKKGAESGFNRDNPFPEGLEKYRGRVLGKLTQVGQFSNFDAPIKGDFDDQAEDYKASTTSGKMSATDAAEQTEAPEAAVAGGPDGTGAKADTVKVVEGLTDQEFKDTEGDAAQRDPSLIDKKYATGVTSDDSPITIDQTGITDPTGKGRDAEVMSDEEQKDLLDIVSEEGVDLTKLPNYAKLERNTAVGTAQTEIAEKLGTGPPLDAKTRLAITGVAPKGDATQIGGVPTAEAAKMNAITGPARNVAAQDMMEVIADMSPEVTAAISQNPATVPVKRDDGADPKTIAAIAALPVEALVSTQMENLLSGMEENKTPLWARPAVDAVNQMMAQRGLTASSVGRDALFNAIIQSALPMAQSNAQALQQRAQQNLSNQQQANLSTAQNVMQIRMQNLANEQTSASQTAQMSQQIKIQQGTFDQQAVLTTAQQTQETNMTNAKMAQQRASQESAQKQQAAISTLGAEVQADLANLQFLNEAESKNMTASQQSKLATYNAQVAKVMRQADLKQNMELAELSGEQQVELANLAEQNSAARESMTAENQERFAKYNTLVDFKKTNVSLAQQMKLANLTNEQQMELANLSEQSTSNSADFNEASKVQLQRLTIYTNMMAKNEDLRQNAELAKLSASEKVQLANLTFQNQADSESLSAKNMAELQVYEKKMAAGQVNAQLAQQMGLANLSNQQSAAMFNAQINANFDMSQFSGEQQMALANSQFMQSMTATKFNADQQSAIQNAVMATQVDLANADARTRVSVENAKNFLTIDMANLSNKQQGIVMDQQIKQQALLTDQAAQNASKQFNATSQNQLDQFLISQSNTMSQFNASARNAMASFNTTETNRKAAIDAGNELQADQFSKQLAADINKFNVSIDNQRVTWNAANAQAVEQSNITWRRQANSVDTAAANAANQTNVQNAYNISALDQTQYWQQLRDEAAYVRQSYENNEQRKAQLLATAIGNEASADQNETGIITLTNFASKYFGG